MSLHYAAQHLASKGRGDDKMLIHMTPDEVGGLQALAMAHGGSLTINPDTGLPEAGFLKKLLPTLIGAGLSFIPGVGPMMAAGLVGGVETLRTGDLGKGIMAGLGAYGGAGIAGSLAGTAASTVPSIGAEAAGTSAMQSEAARQAAAFNLGGADGISQAITAPPAFDTSAIADVGRSATSDFTSQGIGSQLKGSLSAIGQPGGLDAYGSNLASQFGGPGKALVGGLGVAAPFIPQPQMPTMPGPESSKYEGPYKPTERSVKFKDPSDKSSSEFRYFDPFNPIPGFEPLRAADGGSIYSADPNMNYDEGFAVGGLTALAGGRFLQGPGDGTSDSIPAMIGTKQPARLADGEFVIDARTVSELGNGSSKAGAQKLYKMMDRVHAARKKAGRGKDSNADRYMPA